nr:killer cell lectin-like receptor subfamily B member 1B allele B [Chrysemys picta bellii]
MSLERGQPVFKSFLCYGNLQESPQCPRWHGVVLKVGCAGVIVLLVMVAGLSAWVFQGFSNKMEKRSALKSDGVTPRTGSGGERNASLEDLFSRLKQNLCDPAQISSAGGSGCKLCPGNWVLHGDKCYWLSNEADTWSTSHDDCSRKGSQMLVIQDREQMDSLQPVLPADLAVWIGLTFNSTQGKWTWLDGASFHGKLELPESSQGAESNCGTLIKNKTDFDVCSTELKWLCQKAAFQL